MRSCRGMRAGLDTGYCARWAKSREPNRFQSYRSRLTLFARFPPLAIPNFACPSTPPHPHSFYSPRRNLATGHVGFHTRSYPHDRSDSHRTPHRPRLPRIPIGRKEEAQPRRRQDIGGVAQAGGAGGVSYLARLTQKYEHIGYQRSRKDAMGKAHELVKPAPTEKIGRL